MPAYFNPGDQPPGSIGEILQQPVFPTSLNVWSVVKMLAFVGVGFWVINKFIRGK